MLYPIVWLIAASFKESSTIFSDPGLIPRALTLQNYIEGWKGIGIVGFGTFFKNSFLICTLCVIGQRRLLFPHRLCLRPAALRGQEASGSP